MSMAEEHGLPDLPLCLDRRTPRVEPAPAQRGADVRCRSSQARSRSAQAESRRKMFDMHLAADMFPLISREELIALQNRQIEIVARGGNRTLKIRLSCKTEPRRLVSGKRFSSFSQNLILRSSRRKVHYA